MKKSRKKRGVRKPMQERITIEEMNKLTLPELQEYYKVLKNRVSSRVRNFKKAGVDYTPALESLKEYGYYKGLKKPETRSQALKDVRYFDKFLFDYTTSKLRGFEELTNENLEMLTGRQAALDKHQLSEFFKTINKIREDHPELGKGTDRFAYQAVFDEVLTYIQKGYENDDVLKELQGRYAQIIKDAEEKRDAEYNAEVEEMEKLYRAVDNNTIGSVLDENPQEMLYNMSAVDKRRRELGLI